VRRLFGFLLPYRRTFALGLAYVTVTTAITLTAPVVLRSAVDDLTASVTAAKLAAYGGLLLAIGIVAGVFRFLMRRVLIGASRHIEYDMRNDVLARLQLLPARYFQTHRTGDLMSRATADLNAVRMMVGPAVMYSASTILTFIAALALMISIDPRLTLWALVPLPGVSISVKYFGAAIHRRFEAIQAQLADVSAVAQEALAGVRVVRAYRQEDAELARFRVANEEYLRRNRQLILLQGFFFPSMGLFLGLGALVVLWLGSRAVIAGRITVGEFVAFNAYLAMLAWPMIAFGWVTNMLQRGMASWKRLLEILDAEPAPGALPEVRLKTAAATERFSRSAIRGQIEFRDLVFAYEGTPVLRHVSLRIEAGQTVALVGPTGSGKSTLLSLLTRLNEPPPGTVFIDGQDVREIPLHVLRAAIGVVPQEPFLFSDTVAANVAFGVEGHGPAETPRRRESTLEPEGREGSVGGERGWGPASSENADRVRQASAVACLDKDVEAFPDGFDTRVGERGITLSGGQKQRVAIARAVVIDPRILILDDALSAVDTHTEAEILERLRGVMRERTALVVSHRISTVRGADRIFVLDGGRIVEQGTHDDLVRASGLYAALHRRQLLEEELAAS
jgi:ATP-binding cassette subfamily B protein